MASLSNIKFLLIFFFLLVLVHLSLGKSSNSTCIKEEQEVLHKFVSYSVDYISLLSKLHLKKGECCLWPGVVCHKTTGHVIKLDFNFLYGSSSGVVDPSLLDLKHLYYLDLSNNDFQNIPIPTFIGQMKQLEYLDLSYSWFGGRVPPQLGNLTKLRFLDIGLNYALHVDDHMEWIYNLPSLEHLGMSMVSLKAAKVFNLMKLLNSLPFLKNLLLDGCQLHDAKFLYPPSNSSQITTSFQNPASLEILDLSNNSFVCSVSSWIGNITSLNGSFPSDDWLGNLKNLRYLDLSSNLFSGPIPENLGQLENLETLRIQENNFEGVVSEVHFANLSHLFVLTIGNQGSISWKIRSDWVPPFNLDFLTLQYLNTNGSEIPQWIRTQTNLSYLDLSCSDLTGTIPTWLGELIHLWFLDLSNNQLKGSISQISFHSLVELYLARNQINGSLSTSFCKMNFLYVLDISENRLSGSIPDCRSNDQYFDLKIMSLSSNQLSGVIPNSLNNLIELRALLLRDNHFYGAIPSLANCSLLMILDLGRNKLSENITKWVGNGLKLPSLVILSLRENKLNGNIPSNLCGLQKLRILNLANNNITGTIPPCLGYLPGMMDQIIDMEFPSTYNRATYDRSSIEISIDKEIVVQVIKGREFNYSKIGLRLFENMDLSDNKMVGFIPLELTQLTKLIGLNLSHNNFSERIPAEIGSMKALESLDLSCNNLFGRLPDGMLKLTSLEVLNLSYNNFSGHILKGNQFFTLNDPFSYIGNPYLCGDPLPNICSGDDSIQAAIGSGDFTDEDKLEKMWLYNVIMLGYASGFWGVIGLLIFKKSWRYAYFQFADEVKDHMYMKILVNIAKLKKLVGGNGEDDE